METFRGVCTMSALTGAQKDAIGLQSSINKLREDGFNRINEIANRNPLFRSQGKFKSVWMPVENK